MSEPENWVVEVNAIVHELCDISESQFLSGAGSVDAIAEQLIHIDRELVRQLPSFIGSMPASSREPFWVINNIGPSKDSEEKLAAIYRNAVFMMEKYDFNLNTACFLIGTVLIENKQPGEETLAVEQERAIIDMYTRMLADADAELPNSLRAVILKYPEKHEVVYRLISQRDIKSPEVLEGLIEEESYAAVSSGVL